MEKLYTVIGLMSGTSGDGVDLSVIKTDGKDVFTSVSDKFYDYPDRIKKVYHTLTEKINDKSDLENLKAEINDFERVLTLFNAEIIKDVLKNYSKKIDFIGYHGQTIYHNSKEKISRQLGNGLLLSKLLNINVIYNFRQNDIVNGGQGAPLTPIFHSLLSKKINLQSCIILNIGGILNATTILENKKFFATDIGPGMCLIDKWIRLNSKMKYDKEGIISSKGKIQINLNMELDNFYYYEKKTLNENYIKSFSINDFDISFVRGLSLENGAATLVEYTAKIIFDYYLYILKITEESNLTPKLILCGGGRKNKYLLKRLLVNFDRYSNMINLIDEFGINGDFVESQAFGYLAIRSYLNLPITFPNTTGCDKECSGGTLI